MGLSKMGKKNNQTRKSKQRTKKCDQKPGNCSENASLKTAITFAGSAVSSDLLPSLLACLFPYLHPCKREGQEGKRSACRPCTHCWHSWGLICVCRRTLEGGFCNGNLKEILFEVTFFPCILLKDWIRNLHIYINIHLEVNQLNLKIELFIHHRETYQGLK